MTFQPEVRRETPAPSDRRSDRTERAPSKASLRAASYEQGLAMLSPVQRDAGPAMDPAAVHSAARRGVSGGGGPLPFQDRIQQSFGRHDVSGVRAHTGPRADEATQAMGARAYASGQDVVFGGAPDLHTAAHEAAHVVQQAGGVRLAGGVGAEGDVYERHADAVADAVVAGQSAEGLLDASPGGSGSGAPGVQRKLRVDSIDDGEFFDPEVDHVASHWGFSAAEKVVYKRWLKDGQDHHFASKEELVAAIRLAAVRVAGTDAKDETPERRKQIFSRELGAGYRFFDTAKRYETLPQLLEAAEEAGVSREEMTILYKLATDEDLDDQIAAIAEVKPDILMLHEMPADIPGAAEKVVGAVKAGTSKSVGVSNATDVGELDELVTRVRHEDVPFTHVQNRFSPYDQNEAIREYCAENGITYMGYGALGSSQTGACVVEAMAMPNTLLQAKHDPRVIGLAAENDLTTGQLLLGWARAKGVVTVDYSTSVERNGQNYGSSDQVLKPALIAEVDALFGPVSEGELDELDAMEPLDRLKAAMPDVTAWWMIEQLAEGGAAPLLKAVVAKVEAIAGPEQAEGELGNFAWNLIRHMADMQTLIGAHWATDMVAAFKTLSEEALLDEAKLELAVEWSMKNAGRGGDVANASDRIDEIRAKSYVPDRPKTATGRRNATLNALQSAVDHADGEGIAKLLQGLLDYQKGVQGCQAHEVDQEAMWALWTRFGAELTVGGEPAELERGHFDYFCEEACAEPEVVEDVGPEAVLTLQGMRIPGKFEGLPRGPTPEKPEALTVGTEFTLAGEATRYRLAAIEGGGRWLMQTFRFELVG